MRLLLANHSTYPRVGEGAHLQRLRRAYAGRETGKVDDAGFEEIVRSYVTEVIAEQEAAGLDIVTDGLVYAYDVVAHPASRLDGISIAGIVRFFDTNTYVRQPEVDSLPSGSFGLTADFERAKPIATKELKVCVVGPYTLARHTLLKGNDLAQVALAYAEALAADLDELAGAGATLVQIDEPSLLRHPEDAEMVRNLLERARRGVGDRLRLALTTYFGDASTIFGELMKMPVDVVGFDLQYGPGLVDTIVGDSTDKAIALGLIDGRNTKLEDVNATVSTLRHVLDALDARGVQEVHLQPSCGLEFLPRDRAERKLRRMREIADAVEKVSA